jgi:hypothetical protein
LSEVPDVSLFTGCSGLSAFPVFPAFKPSPLGVRKAGQI